MCGKLCYLGCFNEIGYLVFKDVDMCWWYVCVGIVVLFKVDLFCEGIDGEVVDWVCVWFVVWLEVRKIFVVILDGSLMDGVIVLVNDLFYFDNYLK